MRPVMPITDQERDAIYKVIFNRRDVRGQYQPTEIPNEVLDRVLLAAHNAPSVGFMQPWDFVLVKKKETKQKIKEAFEKAHGEAAEMFDGEKREMYQSLKLEGIMEAPVGICVTCDRSRSGEVVIGRTANPEMDLYSSVCAVQNLWLAARAENLGLGWVSIIHHDELKQILNIPEHIVPIAYLCLGYVDFFHETPELEQVGWLPRLDMHSLVHHESWGNQPEDFKTA